MRGVLCGELRSQNVSMIGLIPTEATHHSKARRHAVSRRSWWAHRTSPEIAGRMCAAAQVSRDGDPALFAGLQRHGRPRLRTQGIRNLPDS